jgi:N-formylglutamate deformylase
MERHHELSDEEFLRQFKSCALDPTIFSHEAHLRLAWINIMKYGTKQATIEIQAQLLRFVEFVGEKDKYNKTVTITALMIVNHFVQRANTHSFHELMQEFPRLKTDFKGLINAHYSFDIFKSQKAKNEFLTPDLQPFE